MSLCPAQQASDFSGTWVLKSNGQDILQLTLTVEKGSLTGSLVAPKQMALDQDDFVTSISPDQVQRPVEKAAFDGKQLELTINDDRFVLAMEDGDRVLLTSKGMKPMRLERVSAGKSVVLASRLVEPEYPEENRALRAQLRAMVEEDQKPRLAFDQARTDAVDAKNRPEILRIFDRYGWVTNSLAGRDAEHSFWLLVQHQTPEIQQRLLPALEKAAKEGNASMSDYAYLSDRVQMGLGKPQHWGSAVKCENGKPILYPVDDPSGLDARRKELLMPPVQEYLQIDYIIKFCAQFGK